MKELGFNEECLGYYFVHIKDAPVELIIEINTRTNANFIKAGAKRCCLAPLWQQCVDWLREKYNLHITIQRVIGNKGTDIESESWTFEGTPWKTYSTYQEAREQAVLKCIELCKQKEQQ